MDQMEIEDSEHMRRNLIFEGLTIDVDLQRRKSLLRCVFVGLGLLCAVLLAGNVGQLIYYHRFSHPMSADLMQTTYSSGEEFKGRLSNLTTEKDQLQQNYNSLNQERDRLQTNYNNLQREKNDLQTKFTTMMTNRDELQRSYTTLKSEKDQLQKSKDALQTSYNTLQRERDQLRTDYSNLTTVKDQLEKTVNKIKARSCETGWKKFDTSCYYVTTTNGNWTQSRDDCVAKGADLAVIGSREEQSFINGLLGAGVNAWIGLTDSIKEGTWMWVDGTPVTTSYWQEGQPNSYEGNQDCGEIVQSKQIGEWNDDGCFAQNPSVCEK